MRRSQNKSSKQKQISSKSCLKQAWLRKNIGGSNLVGYGSRQVTEIHPFFINKLKLVKTPTASPKSGKRTLFIETLKA